MGQRLCVSYRHRESDGKPHFVSNEPTQQLALEVRRQIGCGDGVRVSMENLLSIDEVQANGIRFEVQWSVDGPVTNEEGAPVLASASVTLTACLTLP